METRTIRMRFHGEFRVEGNYAVTPIEGNRYRLEEASLLDEGADYGDIIELDLLGDGTYRFVRVVEPSAFRRWDFLIQRHLVTSPALQSLLDAVMAQGGNWERMFGGLLIIFLPPASILDPAQAISDLAGQAPPDHSQS